MKKDFFENTKQFGTFIFWGYSDKNKASFIARIIVATFIFAISDFEQVLAQSSKVAAFEKDKFSIEASAINSSIKIDGNLDENEWNIASADSVFWLHYPVDTAMAQPKTVLKLLYDTQNLYIGVVFFDLKGKSVSQSLQRDFESNFSNSDNFSIVIDPANNAKSGYYFGINAAGAQAEGTISQNGMYPTLNSYWDNKWFAQTMQSGNRICFEIAIPFSTLKFKDNNNWGINFIRNDVSRNIVYSWTWFAANKHAFDLGSTGNLAFKNGLARITGGKFIFIPSVTGSLKENVQDKSGKKIFDKWWY